MFLETLLGTKERVTDAIKAASQATGTSFDYLLKTAVRESALDPKAAAATSSARGLFQFIDTTWLQTVKEDGPAFGLRNEANAIERSSDGQYFVRDPKVRAQILKLRENPEIAAVMAGAFSQRNAAEIQTVLGRRPTAGELYIAHFLGANGAKRFLSMRMANPEASAAAAFPDAARANRSIFYGPNGARSFDDVYRVLVSKHDNTKPATTNIAVAGVNAPANATVNNPAQGEAPGNSLFNRIAQAFGPRRNANGPTRTMPRTTPGYFPVNQNTPRMQVRADTPPPAAATTVQETTQQTVQANAYAATPQENIGDRPHFRGLFQNQQANPLNPSVRELWGNVPVRPQGG